MKNKQGDKIMNKNVTVLNNVIHELALPVLDD